MKSHKERLFKSLLLLISLSLFAVGFNTIDQMVIRYKYYDDWRNVEYWEMCYWWTPHWWDVYILSLAAIFIAGFLSGAICASFFD